MNFLKRIFGSGDNEKGKTKDQKKELLNEISQNENKKEKIPEQLTEKEKVSLKNKVEILANEGISAYQNNNLVIAKEKFQLCIELYNKIGDKKNANGMVGNLGSVLFEMGEMSNSVQQHKKALDTALSNNYIDQATMAARNIGMHFNHANNFQKAIPFLTQSLTLAGQINDGYSASTASYQLAETYGKLENYSEAIRFGEATLQLYDTFEYHPQIAKNQENMRGLLINWKKKLQDEIIVLNNNQGPNEKVENTKPKTKSQEKSKNEEIYNNLVVEANGELVESFDRDNPVLECDKNLLEFITLTICKQESAGKYKVLLEPNKKLKKSSVLTELLYKMPISEREEAKKENMRWAKQNFAEYSLFSGTRAQIIDKTLECIYKDEKGVGLSNDSLIQCQSFTKNPFSLVFLKNGCHIIHRIGENEYLYVSHKYIW
jgi:tetratricopeptide (TPR) repeat protein